MVRDAADFVQKCEACQKLGNVPQQSPPMMTPIISPIPFTMWRIDLVEKLPNAKGSAEYVVVKPPFSLVYGTEAVLLAEVGLPTSRQRGFDEVQNSHALKERLNFIDELRDKVVFTKQKYKHLMVRSYNHRVKGRQFHVGDLVLKLYSASHPKDVNKLSPKWEGPYRISRILGPGTKFYC
ncbi:hypothetical protein LIER_02594 [Lithospermum erythrorhizon]|uniref:Uncharacterized protein n=1 Tax=Lithospermum erythrorhizon TaxID=34254 RepID=A0AAV3NQ15_LITER